MKRLLRIVLATAFVVVTAPPAAAHHHHRWQALDPVYRFHHHVTRIDPPPGAPNLRGSQICKRRTDSALRMTAWPHVEEFRWSQSAQWCYAGGEFTYFNFTTSRSQVWWTHWVYQGVADDVGPQSIDPHHYQYRRTGGEWQWTLPWPIALHFSNILTCSQTVRADGTSEGGCWA